MNNDGWVTRNEWNLDDASFTRLDLNRDNRISRFEFENDTAAYNDYQYAPAQFNTFDVNRDGWLTRPESRMAAVDFDRFDVNRDNRISRYEFDTVATASAPAAEVNHSAAWRTGYDRGMAEGNAAGREDFTRSQGWDLEGQRELERADSGYTPQVGTLERLSGRLSRGIQKRLSRGVHRSRRMRAT